LQRTLSQVGEQLATTRDRIFTLTQLQRHHVVLDLNAGSGLLTFEALRRVPEGGVYACTRTSAEAVALQEQVAALPLLKRPVVLSATLTQLPEVLATQVPDIRFDCIIGRNALIHEPEKGAAAKQLAQLLQQTGVLVLAETVPRYTQRLYRLLDSSKLDAELYQRLVAAEEAIYTDKLDPMVNWDTDELRVALESVGLVVEVDEEQSHTQIHITPALIDRWFATTSTTNRPSYAAHLAKNLREEEIRAVKELFTRSLLHQTVNWESAIAFVRAELPSR
jgi:putative ATPase